MLFLSNIKTKASIWYGQVPSGASPDGLRLAYSHVVVLDGFFGEEERVALLDALTQPGWDHAQVFDFTSPKRLA